MQIEDVYVDFKSITIFIEKKTKKKKCKRKKHVIDSSDSQNSYEAGDRETKIFMVSSWVLKDESRKAFMGLGFGCTRRIRTCGEENTRTYIIYGRFTRVLGSNLGLQPTWPDIRKPRANDPLDVFSCSVTDPNPLFRFGLECGFRLQLFTPRPSYTTYSFLFRWFHLLLFSFSTHIMLSVKNIFQITIGFYSLIVPHEIHRLFISMLMNFSKTILHGYRVLKWLFVSFCFTKETCE